MPQSTRQHWDAGRFLQTLSWFETIPIVSWLQKMFSDSTPLPPPLPQAGILFDFSRPDSNLGQTWGAIDDVVMGGVSASSLQPQEGAALFSGDVSTANSGGFVSVRTRSFEPPLNLSSYSGIELRVNGDGQRYKFLIRDQDSWDGVGYSYSFDTITDEWLNIRVPFTQLIPVFRAKTVNNARSLDASQIRSFQLMLSKFEYDGALNPHFKPGQFHLLVGAIAVY